MNLAVSNPNFSIVTPTGCNASCDFCFWNRSVKPAPKDTFMYMLQNHLQRLPNVFQQCSITGGEPTTCKYLEDILYFVRNRFKKVVLTTNGYSVSEKLFKYIDHLNVSRHAIGDHINREFFHTESVPLTNELESTSAI